MTGSGGRCGESIVADEGEEMWVRGSCAKESSQGLIEWYWPGIFSPLLATVVVNLGMAIILPTKIQRKAPGPTGIFNDLDDRRC